MNIVTVKMYLINKQLKHDYDPLKYTHFRIFKVIYRLYIFFIPTSLVYIHIIYIISHSDIVSIYQLESNQSDQTTTCGNRTKTWNVRHVSFPCKNYIFKKKKSSIPSVLQLYNKKKYNINLFFFNLD